jgi:predicted nucleic acid-binding protein
VTLLFLVHNSVLQRVHRSEPVATALVDLLGAGELAGCLPQLLEEGYSARSAAEHARVLDTARAAKVFLEPDAEVARTAIALQHKLFAGGIGRSVGVSDLQIAATALRYTTTARTVVVVHYDADFENIAAVEPAFTHRWIVPRGSVS